MTETLLHTSSSMSDWADAVDGPLVVSEIVEITHDVKSFVFERPDGPPLSFLAGQYLTFRFDVDGTPVERCYTISSPPMQSERLAITVKRVPDGPVSNWLHDRLRVGDAVHATGPLGRFSHALHPAEKYLFLSAGSGITPLMSMLRTVHGGADPIDVTFVHCAHSPRDIIFRDKLAAIAPDPEPPQLRVAVVCTDDAPYEEWQGPRGRLTLPTLLTLVPDLLDREVFTCGPPGFMTAAGEMLDLLGIAATRRHTESFVLDRSAPPDHDAFSTVRHRVEFRRSGRVLDCDEQTPLLAAAARQGLALPSSCGEGMCGTCKSGLISGRVDMQHAGGIRPREVQQGKILLCCSTPTEDVVIDA